MAEKLGDALLELRTDDTRFKDGIGRAKKGAEDLDKGLKRTEASSRSLGNRLAALGTRAGDTAKRFVNMHTAMAAAAGATGMFLLSRRAIAFADEIAKMARDIGISAEALQEWRFAAGRAGVEMETLDRSLVYFSRTLGQAQRGMKTQADLFSDLGVKIRDANGELRPSAAVLDDVTRALANLENKSIANSVAMEMFGRGGARMAAFLAQGATEIDRLKQKAHDLGIVISDEMAAKAEIANDELSDMSEVLRMSGLSLALEFMPVMRELANLFTSGEFQEGVREASGLLATMIRWMTDNSETIMRVSGALAGMRVGRIAGTPGMVAGGAIGAMFPELMSAGAAEAKIDDLNKSIEGTKKIIDDLKASRDGGMPGWKAFGVAMTHPFESVDEAIARAEERLQKYVRMRDELIASSKENTQGDAPTGNKPTTNEPPTFDFGSDDKESGYQRATRTVRERTEALKAEAAALSSINPLAEDYGFAIQKAQTHQDLLTAAQRDGLTVGPELAGQIDQLSTAYAEQAANLQRVAETQDQARQAAEFFANNSADFARNFVAGMREGKDASEALLDSLARLGERLFDMAVSNVFGSLFGLPSGFNPLAFLPRREKGGRLAAGQASWVGEAGPEIWVPDSDGTVIPNGAIGAAGGTSTLQIQLGQGLVAQFLAQAANQTMTLIQANAPAIAAQSAGLARQQYLDGAWGRQR